MFRRIPGIPSNQTKRFIAACIGIAVLSGVAWAWARLHPRIKTATLAEIMAVLPEQVLEAEPRDPAAESKLEGAYTAVVPFNPEDLSEISDGIQRNELERLVHADILWHDGRFAKLMRVVNAGPMRLLPPPEFGRARSSNGPFDEQEFLTKLRQIAKGLADSAVLYRRNGDYDQSIFCLRSLIAIGNRAWNLHGGIVQYYVAVAIEVMATRAIRDFANDPMSPLGDCANLLQLLTPSPDIDIWLVNSIRTEFQYEVLPHLPDPYRNFHVAPESDDDYTKQSDPSNLDFKTTYDAIETAAQMGKMTAIELTNAMKPLSEFSDAAARIQRAAAKGLPPLPSFEDRTQRERRFELFKFRIATYGTENYFGRVMISEEFDDQTAVDRSDKWRASRSATRVLLASRLYRNDHGGSLPEDAQELVPYLGSWPTDPFDAKPLRYNRAKEVVYSISSNLRDDGGEINSNSPESPDIGAYLTLQH